MVSVNIMLITYPTEHYRNVINNNNNNNNNNIDPQIQSEPEPEGYEFGYYTFNLLPALEVT